MLKGADCRQQGALLPVHVVNVAEQAVRPVRQRWLFYSQEWKSQDEICE